MTVKDQLKILDNKIRQNQADYDLYRKNAKISALPSGKLDKYEYLTGEDLGYRPDPVQKDRVLKIEKLVIQKNLSLEMQMVMK